METNLSYKKMKSYLKVLLLILTILSTSIVIWAGFSDRQSIFPFVLCLTMFLAISNLILANENPKKKKIYRVLFNLSILSVILAVANLIFAG
ncbi:MAG: hypothetical protein ACK4M9_03895 [Anaerobacillus sp.]|uniref:hypothetical protein n=1 Tax=Anaerobacillus sp. TaxID=1872506 RepID=UPI00391A855E